MKPLIFLALLLGGCATKRDPFRENINELIDCEYRYADGKDQTMQQIHDLQIGCYELYKMRQRKP
jgi:hypothetical protein